MAVVRNAANTLRRGRIGETSYYVSGGQQIARQALNNSNYGESASRSQSQQSRRIMWANLVNFYKASASWMAKAFETRKLNQTDYNKFMQVNLPAARIALTKAESVASACIVDEFVVSQGSLPSIKIDKLTSSWKTDIQLGGLAITDATTNAQFTDAVLAYNSTIIEGMQLSFVSYQQYIDGTGIAHVICRLYEVTLSLTDSTPLRNYLPEFCSQNVGGVLGTSSNISTGGFAYILSVLEGGKIKVSTQQLTINNADLITQYTSSQQAKKAIDSYGLDGQVVLSPESIVSQQPEAQPVYIESLRKNQTIYYPGQYAGKTSEFAGSELYMRVSGTIDATLDHVEIFDDKGTRVHNSTTGSFANNEIGFPTSSLAGGNILARIDAYMSDGTVLSIAFSTASTDPDI